MDFRIVYLVVLVIMVALMILMLRASNKAFYGRCLWLMTLAFVFMIEGKRIFFGGFFTDKLFYFHLPFALSYFLTLTWLLLAFSRKSRYQRSLLMACACCFAPAVLSGIPMILRMKIG